MIVWNKRPPWRIRLRVWWQLVRPIPKGEFHQCLDVNEKAREYMCQCEFKRYLLAIAERRRVAHKRAFDDFDESANRY